MVLVLGELSPPIDGQETINQTSAHSFAVVMNLRLVVENSMKVVSPLVPQLPLDD